MIGIAVVMLILAGLVSMYMANKIVEPINNVDLEHPEENQIYEEVGPLLSKIYKQNGQIRSQLEAARRNQEEFTIITGRAPCDRQLYNDPVGKYQCMENVSNAETKDWGMRLFAEPW